MKSYSLRQVTYLVVLVALCTLPLVSVSANTFEQSQSVIPGNSPRAELKEARDLLLASVASPVLPKAVTMSYDQPPLLAQGEGEAPVDVYGYQRKSPARAFLQSFLIPGWGQLYAKSSFWKPVFFVGLEAGGWLGYASFRGKGNDKEKVYQAFADVHWSADDYLEGLEHSFYRETVVDLDNPRYLDTLPYLWVDNTQSPAVEYSNTFSHHAFFKPGGDVVEKDEYYESIGKYDQFNFGWDDYKDSLITIYGSADFYGVLDRNNDVYDADTSKYLADSIKYAYRSPNRRQYLEMRDAANNEFNKANRFLVATVANHLLSAFWAALDARGYNRAHDQFGQLEPSIRLVKSPSDSKKLMPIFRLSYKF